MEADKIIAETCTNLMLEIAEKESITVENVGIRIDLENEKAKPIYSVFDRAKFIKQILIKEIAKAAGAGMMSGLISKSIRDIVKSIFKFGSEQYQVEDTKEIFILLHLRNQENVQPITAIALYIKGKLETTILLSELLAEAQKQ